MTSLLLLLALTAPADSSTTPYEPPAAPAAAPTPAPAVAAEAPGFLTAPEGLSGRREDPGMDQAFLAPTALTQPAMSVSLHDHEVAIVGVTFAPIDRWQITVAAIPIAPQFLGGVSSKLRIVDISRFDLAFFGGAANIDTGRLYYFGAAASVCLDARCAGAISIYGLTGPHEQELEHGMLYHSQGQSYGASAIVPVTSWLKIVAEVDVAGHRTCTDFCPSNTLETVLGFVGGRVHVGGVALNLGAMLPVESYVSTFPTYERVGNKPSLLPAGSVTYRFGGRS